MASTGTQADMAGRVAALLPQGWFPQTEAEAPILYAVLNGIGWGLAQSYSLIAYAFQQININTAGNIWLDIKAQDFLGSSLLRKPGQGDTSYRAAVKAALVPSGCTLPDLIAKVEALTGYAPTVIRPANPSDCGGYGVSKPASVPIANLTFVNGWAPIGQVTGPSISMPATLIDGPNNGNPLEIWQYQTSGTVQSFSCWFYMPISNIELSLIQIYVNGTLMQSVVVQGQWVQVTVLLTGAQQLSPLISIMSGHVDYPPAIFYMTNPAVTYQSAGPLWSGLAYGEAGAYGALNLPFQFFVRATRPSTGGVANVDGWGGVIGGYGVGAIEYVDSDLVSGQITDAEIYAAIESCTPAGSIAWTQIN
ncbi:MAG TPA: hypothetical protein PK677_14285 [Acidiphilium sp.]|nr:hypothetical protein [Acidiphilium sp.]